MTISRVPEYFLPNITPTSGTWLPPSSSFRALGMVDYGYWTNPQNYIFDTLSIVSLKGTTSNIFKINRKKKNILLLGHSKCLSWSKAVFRLSAIRISSILFVCFSLCGSEQSYFEKKWPFFCRNISECISKRNSSCLEIVLSPQSTQLSPSSKLIL